MPRSASEQKGWRLALLGLAYQLMMAQRGITREDLAKRLEVSVNAITLALTGRRSYEYLADKIDIAIDEISTERRWIPRSEIEKDIFYRQMGHHPLSRHAAMGQIQGFYDAAPAEQIPLVDLRIRLKDDCPEGCAQCEFLGEVA